jgi:hypothetical protein
VVPAEARRVVAGGVVGLRRRGQQEHESSDDPHGHASHIRDIGRLRRFC